MKKYRMTLEFTAENGEKARVFALDAISMLVTSDVTLVRLDEEYQSWCPIKLEERPRDSDG